MRAQPSGEIDKLARLAGFLYLLTIPTTGAWYGISDGLLGGEVLTASDLEAGTGMLKLAILLGTIGHVNHLVLVAILHRLLAPFGPVLANLMFAFLAASVPLSFLAIAAQLDLLALIENGVGTAIGADEMQVQITMASTAYANAFKVQAVFWGVWLLPLGWLLLRSDLVPRILAVMVLLGGPFYLMTFADPLFDPDYSTSLSGQIVGFLAGIPEMVGEVGTAIWLAVVGAKRLKTGTSGVPQPDAT